jgi:hypothetical protein
MHFSLCDCHFVLLLSAGPHAPLEHFECPRCCKEDSVFFLVQARCCAHMIEQQAGHWLGGGCSNGSRCS